MNGANHDRWEDNLPAYLLGALEPDEVIALERHTEDCGRCRTELRWLAPALGILPETVERLEPPPELRRRLLDEVQADVQRCAGPRHGQRHGSIDRLRRLCSVGLGWWPIAGLAALAIVAIATAGYLVGNGGGGVTPAPVATFQSGHVPGVTGEVRRKGMSGELRLAGIRPLPYGRVLQGWVRRRGSVEPVEGLFAPDREGEASTRLADLRGVDLVMVTIEPAGGTQAPTNAPITSIRIG